MAWQRFATLGTGNGEQTTLNGKKVEQHIVWAGRIGRDTKVLAKDNVNEITSWAAPDGDGNGSYRFDISMCVELPHADGSKFTLAELEPYAQGTCDPGEWVYTKVHTTTSYDGLAFSRTVGE